MATSPPSSFLKKQLLINMNQQLRFKLICTSGHVVAILFRTGPRFLLRMFAWMHCGVNRNINMHNASSSIGIAILGLLDDMHFVREWNQGHVFFDVKDMRFGGNTFSSDLFRNWFPI